MKEIWRKIEEFPNYEVSNLGRVRSLERTVKVFRKNYSFDYTIKGGLLKPRPAQHGYLRVALYKNAKPYNRSVYRLVGDAFIEGKSKIRNEINHKNGIKTDDRAINLEWVSHKENMEHASRENLMASGLRSGASKSTREDILNIRKDCKALTMAELGRKYNMDSRIIKKIIYGISYQDIPYPEKEENLKFFESEKYKRICQSAYAKQQGETYRKRSY